MMKKSLIKLTCICLFVLVFGSEGRAARQVVGNVTRVKQGGTDVTVETGTGARILVGFYFHNVVRVHLAPSGVFENGPNYAFADESPYQLDPAKISQTSSQITLVRDGITVVIDKKPFCVRILDETGKVILQDDPAQPTWFDRATGEIGTTKLRPSEVETYYGFGEKAFPEMSREGKFIVNWNTDTFSYPVGTDPIYQSVPFFYALYNGKTYGLFFNNTFRTWFDMGKTSPGRYSFGADGGELDYFVFTGGLDRSPKKVLEDYSRLTGRTPLPPIWALGNQQSRWSYFPEKRVREIAEGFRKNKIPADVIYLDIDYMDGYRVFTWDKKRFPDPPKLIGDLKAEGFKTVLIIDPGLKVDENYEVYKDGKQKNVFVKNPDGSLLARNVWPGESVFPDFTSAAAREWFGAQYKKHLEEGIAGFWNDMNEPGVFATEKTERPEILHHPEKTFPYDTPHAGDDLKNAGSLALLPAGNVLPGTHRRYHNVYGMQMTRATFEGLRKLAPEKRPFVLTRAGFAGVQRYSAVWTGDNYAGWEHLALTIPMLANMSVSGVPFVGADVGGFNDMPSGELYARWLQAAALTPFFRSHSVGWVANKEPWEFGEEFTRINRAAVELRYQFLPYLYTLFREHERSGAPVMRPLWYEYPRDKQTYLISDEFMVGSDVLVAPVVKEGVTTRGIYLPVGAEWVDWWTGEKLESGKMHYLKTPLDRLPIFVRVGAVIPTQGVIQHTGEMPLSPVTLNVIAGIKPGVVERALLFQDAGDGYGYRGQDFREVRIEHSQGSLKLMRAGNFNGQKIRYIRAIGVSAKPREVRADGKNLDMDYDASVKRLRVEINGDEKEILLIR
jgi:alpha-glucosidase